MPGSKSEYAKSGVDYSMMEPFKQAMIAVGKKTLTFPNRRNVFINQDVLHAHGAVYEYRGNKSHTWCHTQEGLGNKNWIAEWMYKYDGTGNTYYEGIGIDTALMIVNDVIAQGAMPVVFTDQIDVGDSAWFQDKKRSQDLANGFLKICQEVGMALPAGESATIKYLMRPEAPLKIAPSLSGSVTALIAPKDKVITGKKLSAGDQIIGVSSSGLHANGVSLVIKRAMDLPDKLLTKLPSGQNLGNAALIPTRSYVALIEALLEAEIDIHALLPATGDGVGKLAFDHRPYTYRIHSWPNVPELFQYYRELGVGLTDCLKTFNWGVGYYLFVPPASVDQIITMGQAAGYDLQVVGQVEEGDRKVIFEPENITLQPPGS